MPGCPIPPAWFTITPAPWPTPAMPPFGIPCAPACTLATPCTGAIDATCAPPMFMFPAFMCIPTGTEWWYVWMPAIPEASAPVAIGAFVVLIMVTLCVGAPV